MIAPEAAAEVVEIAGDGDDRHHLGRRGDVEARLPHVAVRPAADPDHDLPERAVVHVDAAPPAHGQWVDPRFVSVQEMSFEHGREQVVGGGDRVEVAREVEVQILHRDDLGVPAARGSALDPEDRAHGRLAQAEHGILADVAETLGQ